MAKTSILMPVYNEVNFIRRTLESVVGEADEIIISDNCSTDGTSEICREFAEKYPEIKYFRQEKNIGSAGNFKFLYKKKDEYSVPPNIFSGNRMLYQTIHACNRSWTYH